MGEIRTRDKRDKLRLVYAGCAASGMRLQPALMEALTLCDAALSGPTPGTFLSSSSEAGGSVSFSAVSGYSPIDAKRLVGELLDYFDKVVVALDGDPNDINTYEDVEVYAAMMAAMIPVRRYRNDYTGLRYGVGFSTQ